jgi:hypothetical protein
MSDNLGKRSRIGLRNKHLKNTLAKCGWFVISSAMVVGLAAGAGPFAQQAVEPSPATPPRLVPSPKELKIYEGARTVMDWTPNEIRRHHFLHRLRPAKNQEELRVILSRVGRAALAQLKEFPKVACDEELYSEAKVRSAVHPLEVRPFSSRIYHFHYIIIPKQEGPLLTFSEYRTNTKGNPVNMRDLRDLNMVTSNFTSSWLYFSLPDQRDSRFRYLGREKMRKADCYVVGFAQVPSRARSFSVFQSGDRSAVVLVQGLAWISRRSFHILRIMTWLLAPLPDVGLEREQTIVDYFPVHLTSTKGFLWLPRDATVTIVYRGAFIRNTHHYSDFKLFRVQSVIKAED